jgi:hypothetical protein
MDESSNLEEDLINSFFGTATSSGIAEKTVPNLFPGATLDCDSVKLRFTEAYVDMGSGAIDVEAVSNNEVIFTISTYPTGVSIGDYLTVKDDGDVVADKYLVAGVNDETYTVSLNKVITLGDVTTPTAHWLRNIPEFTLTGEDSGITVSDTVYTVAIGSVSVDVDAVSKPLFHATVNCGYRALRRDVDSIKTVDSLEAAEALIGKAIPENPLAYGVMITLANTNNTVYFTGIDTDDLAGYTGAKDRIETAEDIYSVVPLTQEAGVLSMFKTHVEAMSQPDVGKWRITFGTSALPEEVTVELGKTLVTADNSSDLKVLYSLDSEFLTKGVNQGDTVLLTIDNGSQVEYTVSSVVTEDLLTVSEAISGVTEATVEYDFVITRVSDKTLQAEEIAATSQTYGSSRFFHVWPDIAVIDGVEYPGYYTCCALAGMVSGLPSQQGFTRISIAGISGVKNSSDYFNATQLDKIADGGTCILMQLSESSPPYIRHQLSTDTSTYEYRELSFTKNFDYVSYICKDTLDGFIGQYNVTSSSLAILQTVLTAALESLKLSTVSKIGAPVIDYRVNSITQSETEKSRVEIYIDVEFPYALNTIGLHIVSSSL